MASLRLTFPEKDQPTVIVLTGARLTIGRLPFNTIQIIDRTVSGFHAELISEHGHYRLHDRGSSNGTFVNGQKVSDYHLNDACSISFGTVEAQFSPEDVAAVEEAETFPSRGEVNAVRQENVEMRATVSALREEIAALRQEHATSGDGVVAGVGREEFEKVVAEREALKEAQLRNEEEINRLKTDLAILKRDRLNLQLAYDGAQREMEQLRHKLNGAEEEPALPPVEAAAVVAAQAGEVRIEVPKAVVPMTPHETQEVAPPPPVEEITEIAETAVAAEATEPAVPADPQRLMPAATLMMKPVSKPFVPLSKAPVPPSAPTIPGESGKPPAPANLPQRPAVLPPKSSALPASAVTKAPSGPGGGFRPLPRPPGAPGSAGAKPGLPSAPRPLPVARPQPQPAGNMTPDPSPKVGPKGTQKITE